jgi:hypothetical protein
LAGYLCQILVLVYFILKYQKDIPCSTKIKGFGIVDAYDADITYDEDVTKSITVISKQEVHYEGSRNTIFGKRP